MVTVLCVMFHAFIVFPPCYCTYLRMSQGTRTYATAETGDSKEPMQEQRNTWMTLEFPPTVCFYYSIHHLYCDKNTLNLELKPRLSWKELNQRYLLYFSMSNFCSVSMRIIGLFRAQCGILIHWPKSLRQCFTFVTYKFSELHMK